MKRAFSSIFTKLVLIIPTILIYSLASRADSPAFDKGDNQIGLSIGFGVDYGNYGYYYSHTTVTPTLAASYDHGFFGNVGPGTIGIGGVIAFKSSSSTYSDHFNSYKSTYSSFIFGVRGTYHLTILKDKNNKFDPYAGVTFGVRINHHSDSYYDYYYNTYGYYPYADNYDNTNPIAGAFVGAHYNFVPSFGVFAEAGYDISLLRIGINFNF